MKTYLIVGGAGFIGSNFVRLMAKKYPEANLVILDALTYAGNRANLADVQHTFEEGDIANQTLVNKIFAQYQPDFVINFAAETHVDRSIASPDIFVQTNILGTQHLLEASKNHQVKRYLQISTDEVYGDLGDITGTFFTEQTPLDPNCPYAATKASADLLVLSYFKTYKLPVLITRCTNNYGPYQYPEKLIPFFISRAQNNQTLPLYGDGNNIRDWLYVGDHCRAIELVLHGGRLGEVYNIGGHNEKTNRQITELILKKLGKSTDLIEFVEDRLAHDRRYAMDASKIQNELGWQPEFPFEVWIDQTITWYQENQTWVKDSLKPSTR